MSQPDEAAAVHMSEAEAEVDLVEIGDELHDWIKKRRHRVMFKDAKNVD